MVLVVPPSSPATTLAELVALARAKPGELNYGSAGNGSDNHLTAELFNHLAGIRATHIPYRGGGQVMTDLIAGRVVLRVRHAADGAAVHRRGAVARAGDHRAGRAARRCRRCRRSPSRGCRTSCSMPGSGCSHPPAPGAVLAQLSSATAATLRHPETAERLRSIGHEIKGGTPQDMGAHLERELNRWAELARHVKFEVWDESPHGARRPRCRWLLAGDAGAGLPGAFHDASNERIALPRLHAVGRGRDAEAAEHAVHRH